jgi:hypothetical protein
LLTDDRNRKANGKRDARKQPAQRLNSGLSPPLQPFKCNQELIAAASPIQVIFFDTALNRGIYSKQELENFITIIRNEK